MKRTDGSTLSRRGWRAVNPKETHRMASDFQRQPLFNLNISPTRPGAPQQSGPGFATQHPVSLLCLIPCGFSPKAAGLEKCPCPGSSQAPRLARPSAEVLSEHQSDQKQSLPHRPEAQPQREAHEASPMQLCPPDHTAWPALVPSWAPDSSLPPQCQHQGTGLPGTRAPHGCSREYSRKSALQRRDLSSLSGQWAQSMY